MQSLSEQKIIILKLYFCAENSKLRFFDQIFAELKKNKIGEHCFCLNWWPIKVAISQIKPNRWSIKVLKLQRNKS